MTDGAPSRLAASLDRLGTESAFSVPARARELEREARDVIHLEIGGQPHRLGDGGDERRSQPLRDDDHVLRRLLRCRYEPERRPGGRRRQRLLHDQEHAQAVQGVAQQTVSCPTGRPRIRSRVDTFVAVASKRDTRRPPL